MTPPRPPSTALEAHALYICWESRLPDLRRSDTLRLLESVISHKTFSSPPPTRFSSTVEKHLFLEWSKKAVAVASTGQGEESEHKNTEGSVSSGGGVGGEDSGGDGGASSGGGGSGCGGRSQPRALSPLPDTDLIALEDALGLYEGDPPSTAGSQTGGNEEGKEEPAFSCPAPTGGGGGGQGSTIGEAGVGASGTPSLVGCDTEIRGAAGVEKHAFSSVGAENTREEGEKEEGGSGRKMELDGSPERHALDRLGNGKRRALDPETDPFLPVYLGLYRNLAEAKGVPSGFKSRTTKSMDEGKQSKACIWCGSICRV